MQREGTPRHYSISVTDPEHRLEREAAALEMPVGRFVLHAVERYLWLRAAYADGARVLVENRAGLLREVRYPGSLR